MKPKVEMLGGLQRGLAEERHLPVDVAARAMHADDGVAAVSLPDLSLTLASISS